MPKTIHVDYTHLPDLASGNSNDLLSNTPKILTSEESWKTPSGPITFPADSTSNPLA